MKDSFKMILNMVLGCSRGQMVDDTKANGQTANSTEMAGTRPRITGQSTESGKTAILHSG